MDDLHMDEDKKPFDTQLEGEDDSVPDPDEEMAMESGGGRIWLVKIPKFLLERWSAVNKEGTHLASVRIYQQPKPVPGRKRGPRFILMLPPASASDPASTTPTSASNSPNPNANGTPTPAPDAEPEVYELEMVNEAVDNQLVIAERPKNVNAPPTDRARSTFLTGRIKHECNLRPMLTQSYRERVRERTRIANTPAKQVMMLDDLVGRGGVNRLSSGIGNAGKFADFVKRKEKPAKGTFERMARMPRNELLDRIFDLYKERSRWSLKDLRARTQQPEAYLKEVLGEVATLNRAGEFNGTYELKGIFASDGIKDENGAGPSSGALMHGLETMSPGAGGDMEGLDEDEDDDDDEDMEEVS